jgi:hypothetical protein
LPHQDRSPQIAIAYLNPQRKGVSEAIAAGLAPIAKEKIGSEEPAVFMGPPTDKSGQLPELIAGQVVKGRPDLKGLVSNASFSGGKFIRNSEGEVTLPDFPDLAVRPDQETGIFSFTDKGGIEVTGICYVPVTGKQKYIYMTGPQISNFLDYFGLGRVFLVDDVATTFATALAMRRMLTDFCGVPAERIEVLAAAKEGEAPVPDELTVAALTTLPEWVNAF